MRLLGLFPIIGDFLEYEWTRGMRKKQKLVTRVYKNEQYTTIRPEASLSIYNKIVNSHSQQKRFKLCTVCVVQICLQGNVFVTLYFYFL